MRRSRVLKRRKNNSMLGENIAKMIVCSSFNIVKYGFMGLFLIQSYSFLLNVNEYFRYQKRKIGY
jgi:hypothetical protein